MANDSGFLATAGAALNIAADTLAANNVAAKRRAEKDFDAALRHYVEHSNLYLFGGLCNAVSSLKALAENLADEQEEFSEADADYRFAAQVLEAASAACDLHYGDRSSKKRREERMAELVKALQGVKP